nr:MAG TPA: cytochrome b6 [Caudoviricetes sp.]
MLEMSSEMYNVVTFCVGIVGFLIGWNLRLPRR